MKKTAKQLTVALALMTMLVQFPLVVHAGGGLWRHAKVLIMKGGQTVTIDGVDYIACTIHNAQGVPIGTYYTPVAALDLTSTISIEIDSGTLRGTFGSILTDGILADAAIEVVVDAANGKVYLLFSGTTQVGGDGDWVGSGELKGVQNIIWRCKFELEVDENGDLVVDPETGGPKLVACLYCVYTLVFDEVPS